MRTAIESLAATTGRTEAEAAGDIKLAVNELVWKYGRPTMTLAEAELLAIHIFDVLTNYDPQQAAELYAEWYTAST